MNMNIKFWHSLKVKPGFLILLINLKTGATQWRAGVGRQRGKGEKEQRAPPPTHTHTRQKANEVPIAKGQVGSHQYVSFLYAVFVSHSYIDAGKSRILLDIRLLFEHNEPSVALATAQDLGWRLKKLKQTHMSWCSDFSSCFLFIKHFFFSFWLNPLKASRSFLKIKKF